MRKKLIVGNWKMNLTQAEAAGVIETFILSVDLHDSVDVGVCPSFLSIGRARELLSKSKVKVGAQDVFWAPKGAFTGSVSAGMLADAGVDLCIVGHSETRGRFGKLEIPESTIGYFAETDDTVNLKIKSLLFANIEPILCVGETLAEREDGHTDSTIQKQLSGALEGIDGAELRTLVVAYEPVWAIGTGKVCETAEAERVCGMIRETLGALFDAELAESTRILYGGSVKAANAKELFAQPNIDGGLVGGASLDPKEFAAIVAAA